MAKSRMDKESSSLNISQLMPVFYDELRRLARHYMARERVGRTLQATALVNEAYLRLAKDQTQPWLNRGHFCAIAANAMREILVEKARARAAQKRGGSRIRVSFEAVIPVQAVENNSIDLLILNEALERLAGLDPQLARIVELRFFGGLTIEETAESLKSSPATIKRGWSLAKAWLRHEMETRGES
jgi:RNA polymerase sigma-70 factor, ECF subfamily